jgi:hypothetical protein
VFAVEIGQAGLFLYPRDVLLPKQPTASAGLRIDAVCTTGIAR